MTALPGRVHGGLPLDGRKALSNGAPIRRLPLAPELVLPLQQHIGEPAEPVVVPGARVRKGELLAQARGYVSVPIHAPTSGRVTALEDRPVPHPSGLSGPCIVLEPDGEDAWGAHHPVDDWASLDPSALRNRVREAGLVGMGGGGFPTFIKMNPGPGRAVHTVILNGAECEPYITCDERLMRERPEEAVAGARILRHAVGAGRCIIGIEDTKPEALEAMRAAADPDMEVVAVPTVYPAGGEKQLTKTLTGLEIPSDGLPMDVGVVMQNVATAAAVHRALARGEPLLSRIVTVTGEGVAEPGNFEVPIGTPFAHLLAAAGLEPGHGPVLMGGPMMGFGVSDDRVPVTKTTNCILVEAAPRAPEPPALPCIRCGACVDVCPAHLLPQQLYWHARARDFDKVQDYNLFDCIECGCCAYVCPSHLPLVSYYRYAKTEIWAQERERAKADVARRRHEEHKARLAREKAEREARQKKKKEVLAGDGAGEDPKKAAIQAALRRARERKGEAQAGDEARPGSGSA
jgi:electron transport complex protein RnfC